MAVQQLANVEKMIMTELPSRQGPEHSTALVEELLTAVSREHYADPLFQLAHSRSGCDMLTVFRKAHSAPPVCLLSVGIVDDRMLLSAARAYSGRHYRVDPIVQKVLPAAKGGATIQVQYWANDASDMVYRQDCYEKPGLAERFGFYSQVGDGWVWLNVYRRVGAGAFQAQQIDTVAAFAPIFLSAVVSKQPAHLDSGLSVKEREVLQMSLAGGTAKTIARSLQISAATVTTYRQRAYAKLNVKNHRELVAQLSPSVWTDSNAK